MISDIIFISKIARVDMCWFIKGTSDIIVIVNYIKINVSTGTETVYAGRNRRLFETHIDNNSTLLLANYSTIRSSEKFLSFYKEKMDAQHFPFRIILSNYFILLFYSIKTKITTFDRLGFMFV